jgi:ABC-type transport system involved in multi-copper enzyme maturation permease subunit
MSESSKRIVTLAQHEYRAAIRSRVLVMLIGLLVIVTVASVYIAAVAHRSQVADYEAYKTAAQANGLDRIAPSPLAAMSLLGGALEYLQIIGSVIAITLGYLSVIRERSNRTLPLIKSRPVTATEQTFGNLLGAVGLIATLIAATACAGVVCIGVIGHDWINLNEAGQLLLAYLAALIYMTGFYCLGAIAATRARYSANGLLAALAIWLVIVLILPQIGDTLDADNQVPGGLFQALGLNRADETTILTHFDIYETIRTRIEYISFAQHFQRFVFAMADVKERYRPFNLGYLFARVWTDLAWVLAYPLMLIALLRRTIRRQPTIPQGANS